MVEKFDYLYKMRLITAFSDEIEYYWLSGDWAIKLYIIQPLALRKDEFIPLLQDWLNKVEEAGLEGLILVVYWNDWLPLINEWLKEFALAELVNVFTFEQSEKDFKNLTNFLLGKVKPDPDFEDEDEE